VVSGASFWAFCEVLWNTRSDEADVLWLVRASALGWVCIGPLTLHLFLGLSGVAAPRTRRALPALYAVGALFLILDWTTPWMHPSVERTSWGWAYSLGPAYPAFYVFTMSSVAFALWLAFRAYRRSASPGERAQSIWVMIGLFSPLSIASMTDGVLPYLDVQVPRLGTASFVVLGGTIFWSFLRYGYSLLAPGDFAREILETLPDGVAMLRIDGTVRSANGALARLLECGADELTGLRITDHLEPPEALLEPAASTDRQCELRTFGGRRTPVAVDSTPLRDRQGSGLGRAVVRDLADHLLRHGPSGRLATVGELVGDRTRSTIRSLLRRRTYASARTRGVFDSVRKREDRRAPSRLAGQELTTRRWRAIARGDRARRARPRSRREPATHARGPARAPRRRTAHGGAPAASTPPSTRNGASSRASPACRRRSSRSS
jgi:PAS domain-containing protein